MEIHSSYFWEMVPELPRILSDFFLYFARQNSWVWGWSGAVRAAGDARQHQSNEFWRQSNMKQNWAWIIGNYTACGHRMAHRKWKETKQQPSMLPGPAVPGCSLVSFHFLWAILCPQDLRPLFGRPFFTLKGASIWHPQRGGSQKSRRKEQGCVYSVCDKEGEGGVQKSENFADIIYGSPLIDFPACSYLHFNVMFWLALIDWQGLRSMLNNMRNVARWKNSKQLLRWKWD